MKYNGCTMEYKEARAQDLLRAYREYLHSHTHIAVEDTFRSIVDMPSRRFWVSDTRAAIVISRMMHGDDLRDMRDTKREMFQEIFCRVQALALTERWQGAHISRLVSHVIGEPAPKFYLSPDSARLCIKTALKEWHRTQLHQLQRWL